MRHLMTAGFVIASTSLVFMPLAATARDRMQVTGSSTVFPFAVVVAEHYGQSSGKTPIVESVGTGGGLKLFCGGVGEATPDIANASRRIKKSEFDDCRKNGVTPVELKIGFDGIVIANAKSPAPVAFTREQIYLALAAQVPGPDGKLTKNPYTTWAAIDAKLPNSKIEVLGPPPTSGTRDSFNELALLAGCESAQKRLNIKIEAKACQQIRDDGAYVESGENDNIILQKLQNTPHAFGIFGFSFLEENRDKVQGARVDGVEDSATTISNGSYPLARPLYIYVKKEHVGVIPGLAEFTQLFVADTMVGEDGELAAKGLVPLPAAEQKIMREVAQKGTGLSGEGL